MPILKNYKTYTIPAGGLNESLNVNDQTEIYRLITASGTVTLTNNVTFSPIGTPREGLTYEFEYNGGITLDGNVLDIFGHTFTDAEALAKYSITAKYVDGNYEVKLAYSANDGAATIKGDDVQQGTLPSSAMDSNGVALTEIAAGAEGDAMVAGPSGVWETLSLAASGFFGIGNGTKINAVQMNGGATMDGNGTITLVDGTVGQDKLSFTIESNLSARLTITSAQVLALNTSPIELVGAPATGFYIEVISASVRISPFGSVAYDTNTVLELKVNGLNTAQLIDEEILLSTGARTTKFIETAVLTTTSNQISTAQALNITVATADPLSGDSDIDVNVLYRITQH